MRKKILFATALAIAKSQFGYDGEETLKALREWHEKHQCIVGGNGQPVEIIEKTVTVADDDDGGEPDTKAAESEVERLKAQVAEKEAALERAKEKARLDAARGKDTRVAGVEYAHRAPGVRKAGSAEARYDAMVKRGYNPRARIRPTFADGESAQKFLSAFRLTASLLYPSHVGEYELKSFDQDVVGKTMSSYQALLGGNWISTEAGSELIDLKLQYGRAREIVGVTPMAKRTRSVPRNGDDVDVAWETEGAAINEDDPNTQRVMMTAFKLAGIARVPIEVMHDSDISVVDVITKGFARSAAKKEDEAYFKGDGSSTYGGFTGVIPRLTELGTNPEDAAGLILAAGDTHDEITKANIDALVGTLPDEFGSDMAVFVCHKTFFYSVMKPLIDTASTGMTRVEFGSRIVPAWDGHPVIFSNSMRKYVAGSGTTERDTVPLLFGNFAMGSKFGEVTGEQGIETSDQRYWDEDEIGIKYRERVAIHVHDIGDTTNPGPICGLIMEDA